MPDTASPQVAVSESAGQAGDGRFGHRRIWVALSAAWAVVTGALPHVLHHVGPLAGAALFAGVGGTLLFGALGLVVAVPFLLRLHRRSGGWRLPGATVALMAALFSLSTFVIAPRIGGGGDSEVSSGKDGRPTRSNQAEHEEHHR